MLRRPKKAPVDPEELAAAAVGVVFERGLHAVTTSAVAERLQVPARALQDADQEALQADAFVRIVAAELAEVKRMVLAHPSATQQMRALLATLAEPSRAEVDAVWVESWSLGRRRAALGAAVAAEEAAWHDFVAAIVRRGVRAGDFPAVDPDEVAAQLLAIIDGVNAHALVGRRFVVDRGRLLRAVARAELGLRLDEVPAAG